MVIPLCCHPGSEPTSPDTAIAETRKSGVGIPLRNTHPTRSAIGLVAVVIWLVGTSHIKAQVLCLLLGQFR